MTTPITLPLPDGVTVSDTISTAALGVVEAYCGWSPLLVTDAVVTLDSDGGSVIALPCLNVTAVSAVVLNGTDRWGQPFPTLTEGTDWDWRTNGILTSYGCDGWPFGGQRVTVTYSGGYDLLPDGMLAVIASIAERMDLGNTIQSHLENVGGIQQNITYAQSATAGTGLTAVECAVLDRWRIGNAR